MKHLGIILASIILVLALATEAKNPHAREIKSWKRELALVEKDIEQLPNDPAVVDIRKSLQEKQMQIVKILQGLDPKGDYSAYLPKSAEQPTADNGTTSNVAEPEDVVREVQSKANPNEEYQKADGTGYGVTANATVSLPHLITYAKSHGSECEFAGNTFGMEIKMFNLQKENELKALYNMIPVVENLCKTTMHWELEVGEPQFMDIRDGTYESMSIYIKGFSQSFGYPNWSTTPDEIREYLYKMRENPSDWCVVKFKLLWLPNLQYSVTDFKENQDFDPTKESSVMKYILDTLWELAPDDNTCESYRKKNISYGMFEINGNGGIPLRNTNDVIAKWTKVLCSTIESVKNNFVIVDNTGQRSDFNPTLIKDFNYNPDTFYDNDIRYKGTGIFKPVFMIGKSQRSHFGYWPLDRPYFLIDKKDIKEEDRMVTRTYQYEGGGHILYAFIPMSEIGKYSSFKIEPKE